MSNGRIIKIGAASINTTVGAFKDNTDKMIELAKRMGDPVVCPDGVCTIGCFQEMTIPGYPAEDYNLFPGFIDGQWQELSRFAEATRNLPTAFIVGLAVALDGHIYNCAAVVYNGKIMGVVPKSALPNYDIFHEDRNFSLWTPGQVTQTNDRYGVPFGDLIFQFPWGKLAIDICEDSWKADGPMQRHAYQGAEVIVNLSASPFRSGIAETRREMLATRSADNEAVVIYTSQVGGNDGLVFDGHTLGFQNGNLLYEGERWEEYLVYCPVDLDKTRQRRNQNTTWRRTSTVYMATGPLSTVVKVDGPYSDRNLLPPIRNQSAFIPENEGIHYNAQEVYFQDIFEALVMGLRDYYKKTGAFDRVVIGLSGGKDSSLALIVAREMFMREVRGRSIQEEDLARYLFDHIQCFSLPTRYNSDATKGIARKMAEEFGVSFQEIPIGEAVEAQRQLLIASGSEIDRITAQNIQARVRGGFLLNWANANRAMMIQTGNMTEKAVGYFTLGGDGEGAYSLIANVPKTVVIGLLDWYNQKYAIPRGWTSITLLHDTEASAELDENQSDEKDLMPFPALEWCYNLMPGEKKMPHEVHEELRGIFTSADFLRMRPDFTYGMLKEWVVKFTRLFFRSIFKWTQCPKGVHIGRLDLESERALFLPICTSQQWLNDSMRKLEEMPE